MITTTKINPWINVSRVRTGKDILYFLLLDDFIMLTYDTFKVPNYVECCILYLLGSYKGDNKEMLFVCRVVY